MKTIFGFLVVVAFAFVGCAGSATSKPAAEETTVEATVENFEEVVEAATDSIEVAADEVSDAVEEATE